MSKHNLPTFHAESEQIVKAHEKNEILAQRLRVEDFLSTCPVVVWIGPADAPVSG